MTVYIVRGKTWPFNYPFGFFTTFDLANESIIKSPDYADKLKIEEMNVSEESRVFAKDKS